MYVDVTIFQTSKNGKKNTEIISYTAYNVEEWECNAREIESARGYNKMIAHVGRDTYYKVDKFECKTIAVNENNSYLKVNIYIRKD